MHRSQTNSYVVIVSFWFYFYYDGRAEGRIDAVFVGETIYPVDIGVVSGFWEIICREG